MSPTNSKYNIHSICFINLLRIKINYHTMVQLLYIKYCIYIFISSYLSLVAFAPGIINVSFGSESITTSGNNKFETHFFQNISRIFKSVSITGFKTSQSAFICSKKSTMLCLFQRVIRNRCKIDTNRASIINRGSSSYYKLGQNYYKFGQLLQVGTELL